jgi:CHAT domain-containing protein/tetratricopeptide (TPR) repeat protein
MHMKYFSGRLIILVNLILIVFSSVSSGYINPPDIFYKNPTKLEDLNSRLYDYLNLMSLNKDTRSDHEDILKIVDSINKEVAAAVPDGILISDSYYLVGIYFLMDGNFTNSIKYLQKSIELRERTKICDTRLARAEYNIGIAFKGLEDLQPTVEHAMRSLKYFKQIGGDFNPELLNSYTLLITAYIELQEYEQALAYSNIALALTEKIPERVTPEILAGMYSNIGVCYSMLADFSKARIYFEKAESIFETEPLTNTINYINLINSLANTYSSLDMSERSVEYFEKGLSLALSLPEHSSYKYNIINSYAIKLGNTGNSKKGEDLIHRVLIEAESDSAENPQLYIEVLNNYAEYLREYSTDYNKSLIFYSQCIDYMDVNPENQILKSRIIIGYSLSLSKTGESQKALEIIQDLISESYGVLNEPDSYANPEAGSIEPDKLSLRLFKAKYQILWDVYQKNKSLKTLTEASATSELIILLLEKIRINISEEDSRLILGDHYRDSYFASIRDFNLLYKLTSERKYFDKAFELSEKSKVAGLLASTRELKAVEFRIPPEIAAFEFRLKRDIGSLNARIVEESQKDIPNEELLRTMKENLLKNIRLRDSIVLVFEQQYPEYYYIKYNTKVITARDIPGIVGRNGNYLNYLLSDTILYILIANRKHSQLITSTVNSDFVDDIKKFRNFLSMPGHSDDAMKEFAEYQETGLKLYNILIGPVRQYLISDRLIVSPDNIISYIPFETLPTGLCADSIPQYRNLPFMMNEFDISYTYSATFLAESVNEGFRYGNSAIVFAPDYPVPISIESVLMSRQAQSGVLSELPYARQEAQFVQSITGGKLYENSKALESVYKSESGKFDIIHLAMHTLLNDKDPMRSTLIFSSEPDTTEDRFLKTYEIYGIPLKAKMVVLSSCNTGSGYLFTGEGILSLARGFTYSGSQSVVMSMWEIEDRSGTEIVKLFYKYLKKGYTKSRALRKARIDYLKNADQLRSHPYFWSALIIYGDNARLYYARYILIASLILTSVILLTVLYYFRKRKYS